MGDLFLCVWFSESWDTLSLLRSWSLSSAIGLCISHQVDVLGHVIGKGPQHEAIPSSSGSPGCGPWVRYLSHSVPRYLAKLSNSPSPAKPTYLLHKNPKVTERDVMLQNSWNAGSVGMEQSIAARIPGLMLSTWDLAWPWAPRSCILLRVVDL